MKIKTLTQRVAARIVRAQRCFDAAPERFTFLTIGDRDFAIVDAEGAKISELSDGQHEKDGTVLGRIYTKQSVHGVSG